MSEYLWDNWPPEEGEFWVMCDGGAPIAGPFCTRVDADGWNEVWGAIIGRELGEEVFVAEVVRVPVGQADLTV